MDYTKKTLIAFDVDQTLTESKSNADKEMSDLLCQLLKVKKIALIGGAKYQTLESCVFDQMSCKELFSNAYNFAQSGTCLRQYKDGEWNTTHEKVIPADDMSFIIENMQKLVEREKDKFTNKLQGRIVENRETKVAVTLAGQDATPEFKSEWNENNNSQREIFCGMVRDFITSSYGENVYTASMGGLSTIDITQYGIDKGYAVLYIEKNFGIPLDDIVFFGDALQPGGNDYVVKSTGIDTIEVKSIEETKSHIRDILNS